MNLTSLEEKFLINILFNEDDCNDIKFNKLDYNHLIKIASNHLMLPSLFCNLKVKGYKKLVPSDFYNYLEKIFNVNFDRNQILIKEVQELSEHLDKSGIEHVFLKGSANIFSKIYLNVGERMVGDIDFLINDKDRISVIKLLESIDYEDFSKYSFFENRHITRKVNSTKIFAVEGHVKLLEKHNELIKEKTFLSNKVLSDGILVPQKKDQLIHNILNNQINDFGYKKLRVNYRSIYDVYRLSKQLDNKVIFNINKYFDTYFMMVDQLKISTLRRTTLLLFIRKRR